MKKYISMAIALLVGATACNVVETPEIEKQLKVVFQAGAFTADVDGLETRTSVEPNADYSHYDFYWSDRDTVGIYPDKGSQIYFEVVNGEGASSAQFDGGAWDLKPGFVYRAYYPLVGYFYLDATKIPVHFEGQKQIGNNNAKHFRGYDFMYTPPTSSNDGGLYFSFEHLITALFPWVDLPAGHYTKLTLALDEPLFVTKGEYDLTSDSPAIVGKSFSKTMSIDLDITLTSPETLKTYIVMAPINMTGKNLVITVYDETGKTYSFTKQPSKPYVASKVTRLMSPISYVETSISLEQIEMTLFVDDSQLLTATVLPENAADKSVTWSSSDNSIATVDNYGNVTALAVGSATITATAEQGGKTATCAVTVNPVAVTSVELNKSEMSLIKGASETLSATVLPDNATDKTVTWTSSDTAVATVDSNGKVTAKAGGSTIITAAAGSKSATCAVTVTVPVSSVALNKTATDIYIGSTETLTATITPSDASNKAVAWSSSKTDIATVDSDGVVSAIGVGTTVITVKTVDGNKSASCTVTVKPIEVTAVELNKTELSLIKGNSETITATVSPANATNKTVTWSSSNTKVASVDSDGKVTAVGGGSATITASAGTKSATCVVTVTVPVTGVSLNKSTTSIVIGNTETLTATLTPSDATNKAVTWSSNNTSVATVDTNGKVTAVGVGDATITVTTTDGNKTASCTVSVSPIAITGIALNKSTLSLTKGSYETLTATITPENATYKTVTWGSSNNDVATVDANGKVTAVSGGSATITATAGGKSATCEVTVTVPVTGVTLNKTSTSITVGSTETLTATVKPSDATNKNVSWSTSNNAITTVDNTGKVTAVAVGTASITVKTADGNKTATCAVTVTPVEVTSVTLNKTTLSLVNGTSEKLSATVKPDNATDKAVTWSTSSSNVATVGTDGTVTAKSVGTATITATSGSKSATCAVTVTPIKVSSITLSDASVNVGSTVTLSPTVTPSSAADKSVTWSSSNTAVATVNASGVVTGVKAGSATITATAKDGSGVKGTCTVTVKNVAVTSITLNKTTLSLVNGTSEKLTFTVKPDNATDKTVTWSSSNTNVATVGTDGTVTAKSAGNATITATANDGSGVKGTCALTVTPIKVSSITLNKTTASIDVGSTVTLTATVSPTNAADRTVTWSSSDETVATVSTSGVVTGIKAGTATITATAHDGSGVSKSCAVTVNNVAVTGVSLDKTSVSLSKGGTYTLTATVTPTNATDKTVTWSSTNTSIATVDQNGKVTAVGGGSATIKAKAGDITASCSVIVSVPVTNIKIFSQNKNAEVTSLSMYQGDTDELSVVCYPSDATDKADYTNISNQYWYSDYKYINVTSGSLLVDWDCPTVSSKPVTVSVKGKSATVNISVLDATPTAVNLGLSVNWASTNMYASNLTEAGRFFSWDDAKARFTGAWRLPTKAEMQELLDNCNATKETGGVRLTLKSDETKSVFFPYTGHYDSDFYVPPSQADSYLWSSTQDSNSYKDVWKFVFGSTYSSVVIGGTDYSTTKKQKAPVRLVQINHINVSSVQLDQTSATVYKNRMLQLTATVSPANATDKSVTWSSSNTSVATVDENGLVTTKSTTGSATISATSNDGNKTATCAITVAAMPTATAVDLGLSVKWASFNVGASSESGYGEFYYWGDTLPVGSGGNCKWGGSDEQERYCTDSDDWAGSGNVDNKTSFADYSYADDAARANWGGTWRMPTPSEIDELLNTNNCTWEWTTVNGVNGYRVTSKKSGYTSRSIFLPAGGTDGSSGVGKWGDFWSSTVNSSNSRQAYTIYIQSSSKSKTTRNRGTTAMIRPVMPK